MFHHAKISTFIQGRSRFRTEMCKRSQALRISRFTFRSPLVSVSENSVEKNFTTYRQKV